MTNIDYKKTVDYWNKRGETIGDLYTPNMSFDGFVKYGYYRHLLEILSLKKELKLTTQNDFLDLGGGTGRIGIYFASCFRRVDIVDFSSGLLDIGQKYCQKNTINNVNFINQSVNEFQTNKKYDCIFLGGVMMCVNDEDFLSTLRKCHELLNPNGLMIIRDSIADHETIRTRTHAIYRSRKHFDNIVKEVGYEIQKEYISYNPGLIYLLHTKIAKTKNTISNYLATLFLTMFLPGEYLINILLNKPYLDLVYWFKNRRRSNNVWQRTYFLTIKK